MSWARAAAPAGVRGGGMSSAVATSSTPASPDAMPMRPACSRKPVSRVVGMATNRASPPSTAGRVRPLPGRAENQPWATTSAYTWLRTWVRAEASRVPALDSLVTGSLAKTARSTTSSSGRRSPSGGRPVASSTPGARPG